MSKDIRRRTSSSEFSEAAPQAAPTRIDLFGRLAAELKAPCTIEGLHRADAALAFASRYRQWGGLHVWLCANNREAEAAADDLRFFLPPEQQDQVLVLPGSEADPYRGLSPHPDISERRALALWRLSKGFTGLLVTTVTSLVSRVPPPANFLSHCLHLEVSNYFPVDHLLSSLRAMGYMREDPVSEMGEFSARGGIVDIFSPSRSYPVRIEFFGDEIESIREFDPSTQRSVDLIPDCEIVPMREFIPTDREIARWTEEAPAYWNEVRFAASIHEKLQFTENGEVFNGFEYLFPLVVDSSHSLFDYLELEGREAVFILPAGREVLEGYEKFYRGLQETCRERDGGGDLVLPPQRLFLQPDHLRERLAQAGRFELDDLPENPATALRLDFQRVRKYHGRIQEVLGELAHWKERGDQVLFVMSSRGMAERLVDIFREYDQVLPLAEGGLDEALTFPVAVLQGSLSEGFYSPHLGLAVLVQDDLFEESRLRPLQRRKTPKELSGVFLSDFRDLRDGDFVVHVQHGIGVFRGLKRIGLEEDSREFLELHYRDGAKLYVPVDRLDLVQKYSGVGLTEPPIDKLGGASWEKTKSRIKKSMRDLADDLLRLYAQREIAQGHAFNQDDSLMEEFEEAFEYEETPDQMAAILDTKRDMETQRPMDRLICGDVGYGKTEVAMRAAFKAVGDSKQVAVLAPTTVLAFQHLNTFRERFQGFPVKIEMVSRFLSRAQISEVLERAALGDVDILIGTHRLLSKDVKFHDLGLVIVDEEQRFGVAQKERLKRLKTRVDVLTLSATPIPRTLNMSLIGLRDLSIIETPPKDRLAIQTVVVRFSRNIIRSAIDLELKREGQIFFVHNNIETIYSIAGMVQDIVPEARVAVAHGRMRENQLEEIMLDFLDYKYDLLVSTTIIENGLDIPRANTLIVNNADRFGLSQLYQLRGRVGRSSRRAYAYLLIPTEEVLSTDARKRLAAIREFSDLGAGFRIAALDLEIRGAGNLLGGEQHGQINAVGFELYSKLLEQTVRELRGQEIVEEVQTSIDLGLDIQIPEHYIDDSHLRLWLYKRVSSVSSPQGLDQLREEIIDRFGRYPRSVANLLEYSRLRMRAQELRILNIDRKVSRILLKFRNDTPVSPEHILEVMQRSDQISLTPEGVVSVRVPSVVPADIFENLHSALDQIAGEGQQPDPARGQ